MLALKPFTEDHGRLMVQAFAIPPVRLLALTGFAARQLACMLYSLVRVSRRVVWKPSASILWPQFPKDIAAIHLRQPGDMGGVSTPAFLPPAYLMLTSSRRIHPTVRPA